ncbi:MAG: endoribonuclease MazF [Patescibacteria group bacterium]|nr:endoribonuclease MazF [Patescibacteria group bacterium]
MEKKSGKKYIPSQGDLVWLVFQPQKGHEQSGIRPAITISPSEYNAKTGLGLFCPITTKIKGYPFEVAVAIGNKKSVVLSDQIKSLDWEIRKAKFIKKAEAGVIKEVIAKIQLLIE